MVKRLDPDVRQLAERMQERRKLARQRVADQDIIGMRFMEPDHIFGRAADNLGQLRDKVGDEALTALADAANYGLAVIAKTGVKSPPKEGQSA